MRIYMVYYSHKVKKEVIKMKLLQYFVAFLVFLAGFAIIDANVNGSFKHNVLAGSIGYLLIVFSSAIAFL